MLRRAPRIEDIQDDNLRLGRVSDTTLLPWTRKQVILCTARVSQALLLLAYFESLLQNESMSWNLFLYVEVITPSSITNLDVGAIIAGRLPRRNEV